MSVAPGPITFASFVLDPRAGELRRGTLRIRLQEQPLQILLLLLQKPGEIVTREEIGARLWPKGAAVESDQNIATAVKKLRQALGDEADSPQFVETIPRLGFRYIGPLPKNAAAPSPDSVPTTAPIPQPIPNPAKPTKPDLRLWPIALAVLAVLVLLLFWLGVRHFRRPAPTPNPFAKAGLTQITSNPGLDIEPFLSPDGSSLAYVSDQRGTFEIYVKSLAPGGREMQLTSNGDGNFHPAWSPNGKLIAFTSQKRGGIWVIPATGGTARRLTDFGSWPDWSPDGTSLAFQSAPDNDRSQTSYAAMPPSTIWTVSSFGGKPTQITRPGIPVGGHGAPAWSPDGKRIVFSSTNIGFGEIWSITKSGGDPRRLLRNGVFDPVFSPDGHSIYYSQGWAASWALMRVPLSADGTSTGTPETVKDTGQILYKDLNFSADGRFMAYTAMFAANNLQSLRISPTTSEPIGPPSSITHDSSNRKTGPLFSPDGSKLAYTAFETGAHWVLYVMNADGSYPHSLTANLDFGLIAGWLPDGKKIVFLTHSSDATLLQSLNIETDHADLLRTLGRYDAPFRVSPDGHEVAYSSRLGTAINIWTAPLTGGEARQLTFDSRSLNYPIWSPDGKALAVQIDDGNKLGILPSEGGPLTPLTSGNEATWASGFSPDGDKVVYAGQRNGVWNIYWVSRSDKSEHQLTSYTHRNTYVRYPAWSPRNDQVVYEYAETTGNIWLMHLK